MAPGSSVVATATTSRGQARPRGPNSSAGEWVLGEGATVRPRCQARSATRQTKLPVAWKPKCSCASCSLLHVHSLDFRQKAVDDTVNWRTTSFGEHHLRGSVTNQRNQHRKS